MRKFNTIICIATALLLTSCAAPNAADNSVREVSGVSSKTETPPVSSSEDTAELETSVPESAMPTEEAETVDQETAPPTVETTAEPEWVSEKTDFFSNSSIQIDMNYDGVPEEFFLLDGGYEFVIYHTTNNGSMDFSYSTIPRTEKIDIYRHDKNDDPSQPEYEYLFSYLGGEGKHISIDITFIGNGSDTHIGGTGYGENLSIPRYYFRHNAFIGQEEFNSLLSDPIDFLSKDRGIEFVKTVNLEELANGSYVKNYLCDLEPAEGLETIEVFDLENDVFGMEKMLSNGKYTVYLSDFDSAELYQRDALSTVQAEYGSNKYVYVPRGELDYLLCFKSDSGTECVYLGTAGERYLFPYNFSAEEGFTEISGEELEKDDWIFSRTIELP